MENKVYELMLLPKDSDDVFQSSFNFLRSIMGSDADYRFSKEVGAFGGFVTASADTYLQFTRHFTGFTSDMLREQLVEYGSQASEIMKPWVVRVFAALRISVRPESATIYAPNAPPNTLSIEAHDLEGNFRSFNFHISHADNPLTRQKFLNRLKAIETLKCAIVSVQKYLDACTLLGYKEGISVYKDAINILGHSLSECMEEVFNESK